MPDIIFFRELKLETQLGVTSWEQQISQKISCDLELTTDCKAVTQSQQISATQDYEKIVHSIKEFVANKKFSYLEVLAEQLAQFLLQELKISHVKLVATKIAAVAGVKEIGVRIERSAD